MSKRASGAPRRPRNPVAKAVRTPQFRQQVVPDKRKPASLPGREAIDRQLDELEEVENGGEDADSQGKAGV